MNENTTGKVSCYSRFEQRLMGDWQGFRDRLLGPFLDSLTRLEVTPNQLTLMALVTGVAFCPLFFISKLLAFLFLALHVLLDAIDGPLAHRTKACSDKGSFSDICSDQTVVALSAIALIHAGLVSPLPGCLYVFFYTVVVIFAMIRSAMGVPYSWITRPRFVVYLWAAVEVYLAPGWFDHLLWALSAVLAFKALTGFIRIRQNI